MKQIRTFSRINLSLLALAVALAGTLLIAGCVTTEGGNSSTSGYQHSHH